MPGPGPTGLGGYPSGSDNYAPAFGCGLADVFAQMQAQNGNDPYFYRKMHFDSRSFQRTPSRAGQVQINDAVLRQFFGRYAPQGKIDAASFPMLIQELYAFENRPPPNYMACLYLMSKYDANQDGLIDYEEFKQMAAEL